MGILDNFHKTSNHNTDSSLIQSIYILKEEGVPVFSRYFTKDIPDSSEIVLLSGFLVAIHSFAKKTLRTTITDVGLEGKRIFFYESKNLVYIGIVNDNLEEIHVNLKEEMKITLETIALAFSLITQETDIDNEQEIAEIISSFGSTCDNIVFEFTYRIYENSLLEKEKELSKFIDDDEYTQIASELGHDVSLVFDDSTDDEFLKLFKEYYEKISEEEEKTAS